MYIQGIMSIQADTNYVIDRLADLKLPEKRARLDVNTEKHTKLVNLIKKYHTYADKMEYVAEIGSIFCHKVKH